MADATVPTHRVIVHVTGEQVVVGIGDPIPPGWTTTEVVGTEQECFVHLAIVIRLKEEDEAITDPNVA